jgi:hypothetical protein
MATSKLLQDWVTFQQTISSYYCFSRTSNVTQTPGDKLLPKVKPILIIPTKKEQIFFQIIRWDSSSNLRKASLARHLKIPRHRINRQETLLPLPVIIVAIKLFYIQISVLKQPSVIKTNDALQPESRMCIIGLRSKPTSEVLLITCRYSVTG